MKHTTILHIGGLKLPADVKIRFGLFHNGSLAYLKIIDTLGKTTAKLEFWGNGFLFARSQIPRRIVAPHRD